MEWECDAVAGSDLRAIRTTAVEKGGFSWIDRWGAVKKDGKIVSMTITLSDWFYEWVTATGGVLSIHEDYFLLTGGI